MENKYISAVTVEEKKGFIGWFLKNYRLKRREAVWMLNYFSDREELLKNICFVSDSSNYPKGILISTTGSNESLPSFRFHKGNLETNDAEKCFHDVRLHPNETVYIELNFKDKHKCYKYLMIEESNNSIEELSPEVLEEAEKVIDDVKQQLLLNSIDTALDKGDQKLFMELWEQLQQIKLSKEKTHTVEDKQVIFNKAMGEATKAFGVDPAYFGEEGKEEVERQLKKMGYSLEDFKKN